MKFGDNLKKIRKKNNLSQEDLAERVRVSRQSVSKWETGDAYPEMNNLLELCKIFKCQINDLVNDNIIDIDSLDEEVLEKIVLLKKDKQKRVRTLSKIIMVISRIARAFLVLALGVLFISFIIGTIASFNLKMNDNEVSLFGASINVIEDSNKIELAYNDSKVVVADDINAAKVKDFLKNNNKYTVIGYTYLVIISLIVYVIILYKVLKYLDQLFKNIFEGETPFTLENVKYIKSMAHLMIAAIIIANFGEVISELLVRYSLNIDFEIFDLIEILFLYSMSYIFEYGYYIQKGTNAVMYGDSNE